MSGIMHFASCDDKCLLHHGADYSRRMETPADRLKQAREKAGYENAKDAALAMGLAVPTYIQHENGTRGYPATKAERYARFFKVQPEWLLYGKKSAKPAAPGLGPLLRITGGVQAGVFTRVVHDDDVEWPTFAGSPDVEAPLKDRYGVRVVGDSMDALYPEGTILECVKYWGRDAIPSGKRVIVQRWRDDGEFETTVKEYVERDGVGWLVPRSHNPIYRAFRCDIPEPGIKRVAIVGIVVASTRLEP